VPSTFADHVVVGEHQPVGPDDHPAAAADEHERGLHADAELGQINRLGDDGGRPACGDRPEHGQGEQRPPSFSPRAPLHRFSSSTTSISRVSSVESTPSKL
jgi:hypothetical protein